MTLKTNEIYLGDCLSLMGDIPTGSVDMILCDLPYGTTRNKWDSIIPLVELWKCYERIIKPTGAIVLTAQTPFDKVLGSSNLSMLKYEWIWEKNIATGHLNANKMPMKEHEDICIFYKNPPTYNPQKTLGNKKNHSKGHFTPQDDHGGYNYGKANAVDNAETLGTLKHPTSIISISKPHPSVSIHPTQKPVEICEWLIKTYTNEGETVLDNCMGSGTTAIACINTRRNYIGFELDKTYYDLSLKRIADHTKEVIQH